MEELKDPREKIYEIAVEIRSTITNLPVSQVDKQATAYYSAMFIGRRQSAMDYRILSYALREARDMWNPIQSQLVELVTQIERAYPVTHHHRYAVRGIAMGIILSDQEIMYTDIPGVLPEVDESE